MSEDTGRFFESREALDRKLSEDVTGILAGAIEARGEATLVVSGGSTPHDLFGLLAKAELPWEKITVLPADERWLDPAHEHSNENLIRKRLLINKASAARLVSLKTKHADAQAAEGELDQVLAAFGPFDLVLLGMGADGHTASLFPGTNELSRGLDPASGRQCIAITPPAAPWQRMSMTLQRLLNSRRVYLHITGRDKMSVAERARRENRPDVAPIAAVFNQQLVPVTLYWAA